MTAAELGVPDSEFWTTTPHLLALRIEGRCRAARQRANERMRAAWHTAAFGRVREIPPLREVMVEVETGAIAENEEAFVARMASAFEAVTDERDREDAHDR